MQDAEESRLASSSHTDKITLVVSTGDSNTPLELYFPSGKQPVFCMAEVECTVQKALSSKQTEAFLLKISVKIFVSCKPRLKSLLLVVLQLKPGKASSQLETTVPECQIDTRNTETEAGNNGNPTHKPCISLRWQKYTKY